jgi:chorismate dehydratase
VFYQESPLEFLEVKTLVPSALSHAARRGDIDFAPVPLVTCFELEDRFVPLGDFCIATKDKARSILLFSKRPLGGLDGARVGLTGESSTSVRLLSVLFAHYLHIQPAKYVSTQDSNDAFILIGDAALRNREGFPSYHHIYDLGEIWHKHTGLPFVFAVWIVRRSIDEKTVAYLASMIERSLEIGLARLDEIARERQDLGMDAQEVREYLEGFNYRLGEKEKEAIALFRKHVDDLDKAASLLREAPNAG